MLYTNDMEQLYNEIMGLSGRFLVQDRLGESPALEMPPEVAATPEPDEPDEAAATAVDLGAEIAAARQEAADAREAAEVATEMVADLERRVLALERAHATRRRTRR